jgi:uncharacterized protein (TIGR02594 family)
MNELDYIAVARSHIGETEIKGAKGHNQFIVSIWPEVRAPWFKDDETPWCAGFVAYCLSKCGRDILPPSEVAGALNWARYGVGLDKPAYGSIAVKARKGGGHVGFVVGRDKFDNLMILGGNQNDSVRISPFKETDFIAFRWPGFKPAPGRYNLPLLKSDGKPVTEA